MEKTKKFIVKLLDPSFSTFVAPEIASILYLAVVFLAGLLALYIVDLGINLGFLEGLFSLVLGVICFFIYTIFARVGLEAFLAAIKTAENTKIIAENTAAIAKNTAESRDTLRRLISQKRDKS